MFQEFIKLELSKQYGLGINAGTYYRTESRNRSSHTWTTDFNESATIIQLIIVFSTNGAGTTELSMGERNKL